MTFMNANPRRTMKAAVLFIVLTAFDLFTKSVAVSALADGIHIDLIKGVLEFYYIQNRGAAFGIFQDGTLILSFVSAVTMIVLICLYMRIPDDRKYLPLRIVLIFICAGAAGNLYDRITLHYVRDFIYFSLIDFPVFNVADIYITLGAIIFCICVLQDKPKAAQKNVPFSEGQAAEEKQGRPLFARRQRTPIPDFPKRAKPAAKAPR